ncbi:hypothetical protein BN6_57880 [Saccharothrix espanaensis DSM 44229]|uniref:Uncharacterized protein n=1 Tax=Saccharothrix espanaensis (strain ATCC 51144 / DSM 44229 / JCM 9112 / NBRC 15066 / NRRL 15764) TaxID=1179773 RepID=K0K412_SACES|nr:hypothetical protein BN6_57880 [Saccharothrix espanaensis DSM 44229]
MLPPSGASGRLIGAADAFDVPVFVRHSSPPDVGGRPRTARVRTASRPWRAGPSLPAAGDYLVTTTWRDVIDAAITVGRDVYPWLSEAKSSKLLCGMSLADHLFVTSTSKTDWSTTPC